MQYDRRKFISFLGKAGIGMIFMPHLLASCRSDQKSNPIVKKLSKELLERLKYVVLKNLNPSIEDDLVLTENLEYSILLKWGDSISDTDTFGFNNDFICFIPLNKDNLKDGLLWVNHEYADPLFVSGFNFSQYEAPLNYRTKDQIDKEMYSVGGTIVRVKEVNGKWTIVKNDLHNRRITGKTKIKFNWDTPIAGMHYAIGTHSNCSGGITPWNTFLTCEENYQDQYGETVYDEHNNATRIPSGYGWERFYDYPPEHYGWVVEVDPKDGTAQKHVALGRFSHECCTLIELEDGRVVAYSGDDKSDEHLYKFVSSEPQSLKNGTLYVADTLNGKWLALDWDIQPVLKKRFKDQTEVLIRAREAAKLLMATELNRPEDIEIDPVTGSVFISLTNNSGKGDYHGSILKIEELNGRHDSLTFVASTYMAGGEENGFSCPDNLAFDHSGNLWFTSDISGSAMNKEEKPYMAFKNNSLFVIPRFGEDAGKVMRVASAPRDAEFTGPWFSPDGETLFLSVQHPGDQTTDVAHPTSKWPFDEDGIPKPSVVAIKGDLILKMNLLNQIET